MLIEGTSSHKTLQKEGVIWIEFRQRSKSCWQKLKSSQLMINELFWRPSGACCLWWMQTRPTNRRKPCENNSGGSRGKDGDYTNVSSFGYAERKIPVWGSGEIRQTMALLHQPSEI